MATGSLYPSQWSQGAYSGDGVQDLDAGVQNEGLSTEDPSHIKYTSANCIGLQVALIPRRDEGCARGVDDEERKLRVCRKVGHLNMHVLNRSQVADRAPSASCGIQARYGTCGFGHEEDSAIPCCRVRERNYPDQADGDCQGKACCE